VTEGGPARAGAGRALHAGLDRFRDDDGSADPAAAAALSAYAAGTGSEHAALTALAAARLLVPVVAQPGEAEPGSSARLPAGDKNSDMALPALVGQDGRRALPAFTSVAALARWQPGARPVPAEAALVWQAAAQDCGAVVIDVAGPVPLAVEGARLAALARGEPVPPPWEDPDVRAVVAAAIRAAVTAPAVTAPAVTELAGTAPAGTASLDGCAIGPGVDGGDLLIELSVAPGAAPDAARALAGQVGAAVLAGLGDRLRRGVALALRQ
jgi:SseB protein N-terminal domain